MHWKLRPPDVTPLLFWAVFSQLLCAARGHILQFRSFRSIVHASPLDSATTIECIHERMTWMKESNNLTVKPLLSTLELERLQYIGCRVIELCTKFNVNWTIRYKDLKFGRTADPTGFQSSCVFPGHMMHPLSEIRQFTANLLRLFKVRKFESRPPPIISK